MLDVAPLEALRRQRPLIHCVSNLVTANDCANLALAVGASPMMACAPQEMAEITAAASATVLNTGTPDEERFEVCRLCGCEAVRLGHPVVLDPVGVGASPWRLRRTQELLHLWTPSILRVNLGEAQALLAMNSREQGVDSPGPASQRERLYAAVALARSRGTAIRARGHCYRRSFHLGTVGRERPNVQDHRDGLHALGPLWGLCRRCRCTGGGAAGLCVLEGLCRPGGGANPRPGAGEFPHRPPRCSRDPDPC